MENKAVCECGAEFEGENAEKQLRGHQMTCKKHASIQKKKTERRKETRVPLSQFYRKLSFEDQEEGFEYRWINDKGDRIRRAKQGSWEFIEDDGFQIGDEHIVNGPTEGKGTVVEKVVDQDTGMKAYLMRIPKEYYDEDQKAKQAQIDDTEKQLMRGHDENDDPSRYIPEGAMKIEHEMI